MPTMLCIETHQPWARFVIHQALTTVVVQIVLLCKSTLSPDEDLQYNGRNVTINIYVAIMRQTINETLYTQKLLSTINNIFHDIYLCFFFPGCHPGFSHLSILACTCTPLTQSITTLGSTQGGDDVSVHLLHRVGWRGGVWRKRETAHSLV